MAKQTQPHDDLPPGHVAVSVLLTGSMGLALAVGLHFFGLLDKLDVYLATLVSNDTGSLSAVVPARGLWIATTFVAYGLSLVILKIPGNWRRVLIGISTLIVIAGWVPVASIAHAHAPVAAPLVAGAWAGLCSMIYAARYHIEMDDPPAHPEKEAPDSPPTNATD